MIRKAPEVLCRNNHGVAVDFFALGVIAYECMMGKRPYQGRTRQEIRDQMLSKQAQIMMEDISPGWTPEAACFINQVSLLFIIANQKETCKEIGSERLERGEITSLAKRFSLETISSAKTRSTL